MQHLITPEYQNLCSELHSKTRWGADGHQWAPQVINLAKKTGATSILDYGCGKGTLKMNLSGYQEDDYLVHTIHEYDPAIPEKKRLPDEKVDIVVCTDVLEHVEEDKLETVIDHIGLLAKKAIYLRIDLRMARTILPDGRNAHLIVKPAIWWLDKLRGLPITSQKSNGKKLEITIIFPQEK